MSVQFMLLIQYCTFIFVVLNVFAENDPSFRIVAPQTICEDNKNSTADSGPQALSVSFQPRDGMKLSYQVQIFFKSSGNRTRTQRRTLLIWKAVRALERRINLKDKMKIAGSNLLSINKTEVVSGVIYIFHITGITETRQRSKEQYFTIKYTDDVLERNDVVDGINFLLLGSENTIASIPYEITALVVFCEPRFDYYLEWKMHNLDEEFQDILHTTASTLKIPPNILVQGTEYRIEVSVLQSSDSSKIAQDYISIQVMTRGFEIFIIPTFIRVGVNKPIYFELFIIDFDNKADSIEVYWECKSYQVGKCNAGEIANQTKFYITFTQQGNYSVSASVKVGDITKDISTDIIIDPNIMLNYEFSHIPNLVVSAGQSVTFNLLLNDLTPKCNASWLSVMENGFQLIEDDNIKAGFGSIEVADIEENYLSEISDYGNSTVSRELVLNIPDASEIWQGLKGDSRYKFQLHATCYGPYIPNDVERSKMKVDSSFEFIIYTNSPPIGTPLEVKPNNGSALKTVFQLSTGNAKDLFLDMPLTYQFLIYAEKYKIKLNKYYDHKTEDTQLPYSKTPVKLKYKVCDIRSACSIINGPEIQVQYTEFSNADIKIKKNEIYEAFQRMDIVRGQNLILMCAITYNNIKDNRKIFDEFKSFSYNLLVKEIDKLTERPTEKLYISKEDVVEFIKQAKVNLDIFGVKNPAILEKLLDLLDTTSEEYSKKDSNAEFKKRRKRYSEQQSPIEGRSIVDSDYVKTNLEIMEKLIQTHNGSFQSEWPKMAQRITQLVGKMCKSDKIKNEQIYSKVAAIQIQKLTGNQMLGTNFTIPNYFAESAGYFTINLPHTRSRVKYYCIVVTQYPEDYFTNEKTVIFNIQVYDTEKSDQLNVSANLDGRNRDTIFLNLPKYTKDSSQCLMYSSDKWVSEYCKTKSSTESNIICFCNKFGYIKLTNRIDNVYESTKAPAISFEIESTTKFEMYHSTQLYVTISPPPVDSTRKTIENSTQLQSLNISSMSALNYSVPFICFLTVLIIIAVLTTIYLRRRRVGKQIQKSMEFQIEPREAKPGIKYAKFHDEDLMSGSFQ